MLVKNEQRFSSGDNFTYLQHFSEGLGRNDRKGLRFYYFGLIISENNEILESKSSYIKIKIK